MKNIFAEIVSIGDELLNGQTVNTNASWIARELSLIGIKTNQITAISDTKEAISESLQNKTNADLIIITGGLGPTKDDITKKTIADFFNSELVKNEEHAALLHSYFEQRGREINALNIGQAYIPDCAELIPNHQGTAPGMWIEKNNSVIISLPGVPREVKHILSVFGLPKIKSHFSTPIIEHYFVHTVGIGESDLSILIENWEDNLPKHIRLAYLPSLGWVKLRLTGTGNNPSSLKKDIEDEVKKLKGLIPDYIFSETQESLPQAIGRMLKNKGLTIGTAESCTGGYIAHQLTSIAGSSSYFQGSVISYSNEVKNQELGVRPETLATFGAVSEETVREMAEGLLKKFNIDIAVSCSGIAGPDGGSDEKPVGTVWIALATKNKTISKLLKLRNERMTNIELTSLAVLNLVRITLNSPKLA